MNAEQFFKIYADWLNAESVISDRIMELLGTSWVADDCPASDITFDAYDLSFELIGVRDDFRATKEQQKALNDLGFIQFWFNHQDKTETHYGKLTGETRNSDRTPLEHGDPMSWRGIHDQNDSTPVPREGFRKFLKWFIIGIILFVGSALAGLLAAWVQKYNG